MKPTAPIEPVRGRVAGLGLLVLITLAGAELRCYQLRDVLWIDELHTSWVVAGKLGDVAGRAWIGNQSPLYFYAAWLSTRLFGMNEVALRLPSLIAGIALIPLAFWAVRRWTGSVTAALLASALVAVERDFVFYSQEARPYAALQLMTLIQWMLVEGLLAGGERGESKWYRPGARRVGLIAVTAVMIYLHYTAALLISGVVVGYAAVVLVRRRKPVAYRPACLAFDFVLAAVLCGPTIPHLHEIAGRRGQWSSIVEDWPSPRMLRMAALYVAAPLLLAAVVGAIRWCGRYRPLLTRIRLGPPILVGCWTFVPIAAAWLATLCKAAPLTMFRYVVGAAIGQMLLAGLLCAVVRPRGARIAVALLVLATAVAGNYVFFLYAVETKDGSWLNVGRFDYADGRLLADRSEDWAGVAELINRSGQPRQPVLLCANLVEDELLRDAPSDAFREYSTFALRGMYPLRNEDREVIPLPAKGADRVRPADATSIAEHGGGWLVVRGSPALLAEIAREAADDLRRAGRRCRVGRPLSFGNVHVLKLDVEPKAPVN